MKSLPLATALLAAASAAATVGVLPVQADWPTYHLDNRRSADGSGYATLASPPAAAWNTPLDGLVFAEPLVYGNQVIVATENDSVYSLDLHTGAVNWRQSVAGTGRHPVPRGQLPCGDIDPTGVTGTPVIDAASGKVFVVAESWDGVNQSSDHHSFWALDLNNGGNPTVAGANADPPTGFDPLIQQQRAALALNSGHVYFAYGGRSGDCGIYHGWVGRIEENGTGFISTNVTAAGERGGIWAPSGPAIDAAGNVFVTTGNGNQTNNSAPSDLTDSVVKLSPSLAVLDHFTPTNWGDQNHDDVDLGSTGPLLLNGGLVYQVGKSLTAFLLQAASLGGGRDTGGEAWSGTVCQGYGGSAYDATRDIVYSSCRNGVQALQVHRVGSGACPGAEPCLQQLWRGPADASAPPILLGNTVWVRGTTFGAATTNLYGLDASNGSTVATLGGIDGTAHFVTPSASAGVLLLASGSSMRAWSGAGVADGWSAFGGASKGRVALITDRNGRVQAFIRGMDDALWHRSQLSPNGPWSDWTSLGGVIRGDPAVAANADGRLEAFAVGTDQQLWHRWEQGGLGGPWADWAPLGGSLAGRPAVVLNTDGRLEVFTRGSDGGSWHVWQVAAGANWGAQDTLGGTTFDDPAAGLNADGRLEVFVRGTDRALWTQWQRTRGGGWSGWGSLGGDLVTSPSIGIDPDGRMEAFNASPGHQVVDTWQVSPNGGWHPHASLGGNAAREIAVGRYADGRLAAFAVDGSGVVARSEQGSVGGGWTPWSGLPLLHAGASPGVTNQADGSLGLFAPAQDSSIWTRWQKAPNGSW